MSKAGARCLFPAASAWCSVQPSPCLRPGIHLHGVAGWQVLCSRDFTHVLLSAPQRPGCHLRVRTRYPMLVGPQLYLKVFWMSPASAWFVLRRFCSLQVIPLLLNLQCLPAALCSLRESCTVHKHVPLAPGDCHFLASSHA